jgi:hypothetical protein
MVCASQSDRARVLREFASELGCPHAARRAFEQFDAKIRLEAPQALAEGGLGNAERLCRRRQATLFDDGDDMAHLLELHRYSPRLWIWDQMGVVRF